MTASLAPLTAAPAEPRLSPWTSAHLRWWIYRPEHGAFADAGGLIAELVRRRTVPASPWLARVDGGSEDLRYVAALTGDGLSPVPDGVRRPFLTGRIDAQTAARLLDAAQSADAAVVLLSIDDDDLATAEKALLQASTAAPPVPRLVVLCPPGARWILLGSPGEQPPAVGVAATAEPEPPPEYVLPTPDGHRVARQRSVLALTVLTAVAATGVVSWRGIVSSSPASPAVASAPVQSSGSIVRPAADAVAPSLLPTPRLSPSIVYDRSHAQTLLFGVLGPPGSTWLWRHGDWREVQTAESPPERFGVAAAYDPQQGRVVVFGEGQASGDVPGDTWSWDGRSWSRSGGLPGGPPGFQGAGMAFDEARGAMVLVTPAAAQGGGMQTWTLAGSRWVNQGAASTLPPQSRPAMAFDPQTSSVLMVSAGPAANTSGRTWSWDGSWHDLHPRNEPPGGAGGFMTTDPMSGRLLLMTPSAQGGFPLQTWTWDGHDWSQQHPATNPRGVMGVATDLQAGVALAFGFARPGAPGSMNAAWAWSGTTWVQLATTPPPGVTETIASPPPRGQAWLAYDEADAHLVLFGGVGEPGRRLNDTWLWDGSSWSEAPGAGSPPDGGPMAFDPVTRNVLLVSQTVGARALPVLQTWAWNGSLWRPLLPAREISSSLSVAAIQGDPATGQVVAVALCCVGADGRPSIGPRLQTWTWDGSTWTRAHPVTELSGGGRVEMAYDGASHRLIAVVAAGQNSPPITWSWDGSTWSQLGPSVPTAEALSGMTMAYDPSTEAVVSLSAAPPAPGELPPDALLAVWSGKAWTAVVDPFGSPAVDTTMHATRLFFEPHIGRLVVLGSPEHDYSRAWMWTGRSWLELDAPHL